MRFFSNENREPDDEPSNVDVQTRAEQENPDQAHDQHPERVESEPVAVPQQRSGSPWSDTPGAPGDNADAELADQERADGTDEQSAYRGDDAADRPDDADQGPTETVAGADHDHEAHDHDGHDHDGHDHDAHDHDAHDDESHDGVVDVPLDDATSSSDEATPSEAETSGSTTTTYGPDGTVTTTEGESTAVGESDDDESEISDETVKDSLVSDSVATDSDSALKDEGDFDDPTAVDPATDKPLDTDDSDASPDADTVAGEPAGRHEAAEENETAAATNGSVADDSTAPVVPIPVPVGADADRSDNAAETSAAAEEDKLPGSVAEPDLSKVFSTEDAQSFQDRWRDVQLRFVDSPQEATADAASLLDEVVDKLASSLRAQKDSLSQDASNDTERLRVELRGYRELFTRVLGL
jgi:hypothetical protein